MRIKIWDTHWKKLLAVKHQQPNLNLAKPRVTEKMLFQRSYRWQTNRKENIEGHIDDGVEDESDNDLFFSSIRMAKNINPDSVSH